MPTRQEYLNLFSNYVTQMKLDKCKNLVDLGCGSGILDIIVKECAGFEGKYTLIDQNESSLDCSRANLEMYGVF